MTTITTITTITIIITTITIKHRALPHGQMAVPTRQLYYNMMYYTITY